MECAQSTCMLAFSVSSAEEYASDRDTDGLVDSSRICAMFSRLSCFVSSDVSRCRDGLRHCFNENVLHDADLG